MINNEIKLYEKDASTLIGTLSQVVSCEVEEERNGIYEVVLTSPITDPLFKSLVKENVLVCKPNDMQELQAFRIYNVGKFMNSISVVYARHISFDLAGDLVDKIELVNASCEFALNSIFRQSQFCNHYVGYSDIINAQNYSMELSNCLEAIAGREGSIVDTYGNGAEILRDNTNIHVLNKRGHDNGVTIEYGKNLTGFEFKEDVDGLVTAIKPWCKVKNEDDTESILRGDLVKADNWELFSHPYILSKDYSDKFNEGETPTKEKLKYYAEQDFLVNKLHIPKANYKIEFIPLSKCVGYEDIEDKISLCDTVTIKDYRYGIDTKAKVIKYKYDVITQKYISMEIGEPRTTLGDIITANDGKDGENGKDGQDGAIGPQGPPGKDADVEDMPDTLPAIPVLTPKVYGMGSVELSWTFENKLYYTYELYASRTKDFTPNFQDLIHAGQSSSFLFKANPDETWYFKVCAMNSHNRRTGFSNQVEVALPKIEDMNNYFSEIAIGHAVAQSITADYMEAGMFKGHWIDAKNLSVTDGNGKRTFDIDSFGRLTMMPTSFKLLIDGREEGVVTQSAFNNTLDGFEYRFFNNTEPNMLRNTSFLNGWKYWNWNGSFEKFIYHDGNFGKGDSVRLEFTEENQGLYQRDIDCTHGVAIKVCCNASRPINIMVGIEGVHTKVFTIGQGDGWSDLEVIVPPMPKLGTFIFYTQAGGAHTVYANQFKVQTGNICTPWSPHREEIYSNTTTIDGEGIEIRHDNGSRSKFTHEAIDFFNSQGRRTLRIKDGGFNFHTWQDPAELVGFIKSSVLPSMNNYNGVTLSTYGLGDYISIGTSESQDENSWTSKSSIFIAPHGDMGSVTKAGTWFLNQQVYSRTAINAYSGLTLNPDAEFPHRIYNSTENKLCVFGDNHTTLGIRYGNQNNTAIEIVEDEGQVSKTYIHAWGDWDFHNYTIRNVKIAGTLQAQSSMLRSFFMVMPSQVNDIYSVMSMTDGELRYTQRKAEHITNKTLIVELPHVFSENIELDYHINISKLSWGDYRIIEKTPYYFEIETNVDDFSFTYEVVAKTIEKADAYSSIASAQYGYSEENVVEEGSDTIQIIK